MRRHQGQLVRPPSRLQSVRYISNSPFLNSPSTSPLFLLSSSFSSSSLSFPSSSSSSSSSYSFHGRCSASQVSPEEWQDFSNKNVKAAEQQRTNSKNLRSMVDTSLATSTNDMNVQVERTNEALRLLLWLQLLLSSL